MTPAALKRLRARLGVTQAELAKQLGVTRNTVGRWEIAAGKNGHRAIGPVAVRLLRLLARRDRR